MFSKAPSGLVARETEASESGSGEAGGWLEFRSQKLGEDDGFGHRARLLKLKPNPKMPVRRQQKKGTILNGLNGAVTALGQ